MFAIIQFGNCHHLVYIKRTEDNQKNSATCFRRCEMQSLQQLGSKVPWEISGPNRDEATKYYYDN
jgi:hypothetical protein